MRYLLIGLAALNWAIGCSDGVLGLDASGDAGRPQDVGFADAWDSGPSPQDAGVAAMDVGPLDTGPVLPDLVTIASGVTHSCERVADGRVRCWGANTDGQLGDGSNEPRSAPVFARGLSTVRQMTAGAVHSCALLADRTVYCWGRNTSGQLGDGTFSPRFIPTRVEGLNNVVQISAGNRSTCARLEGGGLRCWGHNEQRQLGDGTNIRRNAPVEVTLAGIALEVAVGDDYTCARMSDETVRCWGFMFPGGLVGEFGPDATITPTSPVEVPGLRGAVQLSAGGGHLCARFAEGKVSCMGANTNGGLGNGSRSHSPTPVSVINVSDAVQVAAGTAGCALHEDGKVSCWGGFEFAHRPTIIEGLDEVVEISQGGLHACARRSDGTVRCWGANGSGQVMAEGCCHAGICGIPEGTSCGASGGTCGEGWCSGCGGEGQPCCDRIQSGGRCRGDSPLCTDQELCTACGGLGEPCCVASGTDACDGSAVCFQDTCTQPGLPGTPCLPGNLCPGGCCVLQAHSTRVCVVLAEICPSQGDVAGRCTADGSCGGCGGLAQACCPSPESSRVPAYCSAPNAQCVGLSCQAL